MHTQLIADDDEDVEENPEDRDEETELMKEEMKELVRNVTKKRKEEGQLNGYSPNVGFSHQHTLKFQIQTMFPYTDQKNISEM